jgi:hypothetical protein
MREKVSFAVNEAKWVSPEFAREQTVDDAANWTMVWPVALSGADDVESLQTLLAAETDGASGADQIGATPIAGVGTADTDTVQEIMEAIVAMMMPLAGGTFTGHITMTTAKNIVLASAGAGTQIGTAANQKLGLWGATPVVQQAHIADADDSVAEGDVDTAAKIAPLLDAAGTKINAILAALEAVGILATS